MRSLFRAAHVAVASLALLTVSPTMAQPDAVASRAKQHNVDGLSARQGEGSFGPVTFDAATAPFALRNNNWVGIKGPNLNGRWPGQTGADAHGFARFDDPAYSISSFIELLRTYQDKYKLSSAKSILARYAPTGDCSGAPSLSASKRSQRGGCVENQVNVPVTAVRAARAVGMQPGDNLDLFGPDGKINHPDRLRALIDAVVTQEVGSSHCPQPPRGEFWIGCRTEDGMYNHAVELLDKHA